MTSHRSLFKDLDSLPYPAYDMFPLEEVYFPNSQALFSEEGMLARRRLDINASYGCSLVCKFCFHLGIAGDMKYVQNPGGAVDVAFDAPGNYTRNIRYHSPEYIGEWSKDVRGSYLRNVVGLLSETLM